MSDLVPDTYAGPYGRFQAKHRTGPAPDRDAQMLARLRDEVKIVRRANEVLARERIEVEQALGRSIHAGQLGQAVRAAIHRESVT